MPLLKYGCNLYYTAVNNNAIPLRSWILVIHLFWNSSSPATLNSVIVDAGDSFAVIIKARMAPGWHIYAYVPSTMPYIVSECIFRADTNVRATGTWQKPLPIASREDAGVLLYEKEAVFIHKFVRKDNLKKGTIVTGLYYQVCNLLQCLPPEEKTFRLSY